MQSEGRQSTLRSEVSFDPTVTELGSAIGIPKRSEHSRNICELLAHPFCLKRHLYMVSFNRNLWGINTVFTALRFQIRSKEAHHAIARYARSNRGIDVHGADRLP